MIHLFTAGAWNPDKKTAGYAVLFARESLENCGYAAGTVRVSGNSDACGAELVAVENAVRLMQLAGEDEAVLHPSNPLVAGGLARIAEKNGTDHRTRTIDGFTFMDFGDDGVYLRVDTSGGFGELSRNVRQSAASEAGLDPADADEACRKTGGGA